MNTSARRTISRIAAIAAVAGASAFSTAAHAQVTFDWTLNGSGYSESGKLITASGSLVGGNAPAGDYTASNWIVTGSTANPGLVGASVSGGQLKFNNNDSFHWNGSSLTSIGGGFGRIYVRTPDLQQGWMLYDQFGIGGQIDKDGLGNGASYTFTVEAPLSPASTPEPGSVALFAAGGLVALRQLRRRKSA